jgi:hypothetical protein
LVLKISARSNYNGTTDGCYFTINNYTAGSVYSGTSVKGDGSATSSKRLSNATYMMIGSELANWTIPGNTSTSNTFGNWEVYLPTYTSSNAKPLSSFSVGETNASTINGISCDAFLWNYTSTISSLELYSRQGSFVSGSSFWLYGIKNS